MSGINLIELPVRVTSLAEESDGTYSIRVEYENPSMTSAAKKTATLYVEDVPAFSVGAELTLCLELR